MPNIWTHILFAEEVMDAVKQPSAFFAEEAALKLGAQGPDPFFYYNFWPWKKEQTVHEVGMAMHTRECGNVLLDMITSPQTESAAVRAFVAGFITHHILDRHTHPYVHYRAGYEGNNHQRLEVIIDTLMMQKFHQLTSWKAPVYKEIDVGPSLPAGIYQLLHDIIPRHYPEFAHLPPAYIQKSYKDLKLAQRILADPYGWKNNVLGKLIDAYSHKPVEDTKDFLNLEHTTWLHPATKNRQQKALSTSTTKHA